MFDDLGKPLALHHQDIIVIW